METMSFSLPEEMRVFLEVHSTRAGYTSAGDYLRALIVEAKRRAAREELESKLAEGLRGEPVAMTRDDWDSIRREATRP